MTTMTDTTTALVIFRCRGEKGCGKTTRRSMAHAGYNFVVTADVGEKLNRYRSPSGREDRDARPMIVCACGRAIVGRLIAGKFNAAKKCSARCQNAIGPSCECSCAGENHGGSHG